MKTKVKKATKVKRQHKLKKLVMACGYQRNEVDSVIKNYQTLYTSFDDFTGYLKEQVAYKKEELKMLKELKGFGSSLLEIDSAMESIQFGSSPSDFIKDENHVNEISKEANLVKKTLEEV